MLEWLTLALAGGMLGFAATRKARLLEQPVRQRLIGLIDDRPGIHASELCRQSGESWGTVQYHLGLLGKAGMVTSVATGRERRFFAGDVGEGRARLVALLEKGRSRDIAGFIHANPGARQVDVCEGVNVSRKAFRSSVRPLVDEGLIQERRGLQHNQYFVDERFGEVFQR